jgi:tetratricopeptide (TPR) repeat protein
VKLIQRALDKEPDNGAYLDSLGWAYFKQGKKDQALKQLELAAQEEPDPVVVDHLGDALLAAGRAADACAKWRKVLELDPDPKLAESIKKKLQEHGGAEGRKPQNTE